MDFVLQPWQLYFVILVGWVQRQQQEVIHYLIAENRVLKERIGKKRILLNDDQRRRLAVKGKLLGRKCPPAAWHRTGTRSNVTDHLGDVPEGPLGRAGGDRLHDRRSLDQGRLVNILSAVRHGG